MNEPTQQTGPSYRTEILGLFYPALGLVRYNFDWRRYGHLDRPIANNRQLMDEYGTIHHEIYHYLQTISTTYCYYLFLLECTKAAAYEDIIQFVRDPKLSLRLPLWAQLNIPEVARSTPASARRFRDSRFQHGNSANVLQELLHKGTRIRHMGPDLLQAVARWASAGLSFQSNQNDAFTCARAPLFDLHIDIGEDINPCDESNVQVSGEMVMENAAFMISSYPLWHEESRNSTALALEEVQHFGTTFYTRLIELAARELRILDATTFKNTFLALADLALNFPIQSANTIRPKSSNWKDLHPGWRFIRGINVARGIKPIRRYSSDYARFVGDICRKLRWTTPITTWREFTTAALGSSLASIWLDQECSRVAWQKERCPWRYFDPGDDLFTATDWIAQNFPPMVEDCARGNVILARKSELGYQTLRWYVDTKLPQQIMLGRSLSLYLPGISADLAREIVSAKLTRLNLTASKISTLSPEVEMRGYQHYARRRKHYRGSISSTQFSSFFRKMSPGGSKPATCGHFKTSQSEVGDS